METTRETVYEADSEKILGAVMSNAEMAKHAVITVLDLSKEPKVLPVKNKWTFKSRQR